MKMNKQKALVGKVFGPWKVTGPAPRKHRHQMVAISRSDLGLVSEARVSDLLRGKYGECKNPSHGTPLDEILNYKARLRSPTRNAAPSAAGFSVDNREVTTHLGNGVSVVKSIQEHTEMREEYSDYWDSRGMTMKEVAAKHGLTAKEFEQYKKIHGWTKRDVPVTDIDLNNLSEDQISERLIARKKRSIDQKTQIKLDSLFRQQADKWMDLEARIHTPFKNLAPHIQLGPVPKLDLKKPAEAETRKLIINACDWQVGELAQGCEMNNKKGDYNIDIAREAIQQYVQRIANHVKHSGYNYDEVFIFDLGDLGHGLNGFTSHGTPLEVDRFRSEQVEVIFDGLTSLINGARQIADKVTVAHVEGNHLGYTSTLIFDQIAYWYGGENPVSDVEIIRNTSPLEFIPVGETLFVLFHGKSGAPGAKDLGAGSSREANAYRLIHSRWKDFPQCKHVVLVTAHVHHIINEEFQDFTICTLSTLCQGDRYANGILKSTRVPTQTIMEVDPRTGLVANIPVAIQVE